MNMSPVESVEKPNSRTKAARIEIRWPRKRGPASSNFQLTPLYFSSNYIIVTFSFAFIMGTAVLEIVY